MIAFAFSAIIPTLIAYDRKQDISNTEYFTTVIATVVIFVLNWKGFCLANSLNI